MTGRTDATSGARQPAAREPVPADAVPPHAEVSASPRWADIAQLQAASVMHRQECRSCTRERSCPLARRLEAAYREARGRLRRAARHTGEEAAP